MICWTDVALCMKTDSIIRCRRVSAALRVVPDSHSWIDLSFLAILGVSGGINGCYADRPPNPPDRGGRCGERLRVLLVTEKKQISSPSLSFAI